ADRDPQPLEMMPQTKTPAVDPLETERQRSSEAERDQRLFCLQDCLDRLPPASRDLLTVYHLGESGIHIGRRKRSDRLRSWSSRKGASQIGMAPHLLFNVCSVWSFRRTGTELSSSAACFSTGHFQRFRSPISQFRSPFSRCQKLIAIP